MKWNALDVPETHEQTVEWLEKQLLGPHLRALASQLAALADEPKSDADLDDILGEAAADVEANGLGSLSEDQLHRLLAQPLLLFDLQQRVLEFGSEYWESRLDNDPALTKASASTLSSIKAKLIPKSTRRGSWTLVLHPAALGTFAVTCLLALAVLSQSLLVERQPATWGWAKPGALPANVDAAEYLKTLADAGGQWFSKRPSKPAELSARILQFRRGCSVLLLSDHQSLSEADRTWLRERCRAWADKLDRHLADLEAGKPTLQVRDQVDDTINSLIEALKERAQSVVSA